jgi:hypothetical protein
MRKGPGMSLDGIIRTSVRGFTVFIFLAALFCLLPPSAFSRVIAHDTIGLKGQKLMLKAETRGRLFSQGGELVEFFVDAKSIGKTLSGGDGVAFKPFTPARTGLHQIRVTSAEDEDTGLLLSLKRGSSIVFVDVQASLLESLFSRTPKEGSQKAIGEIHNRYPIVFLQTGFVGIRVIKAWLKENKFEALPLIPWSGGAIFDEIADKDLRIKAIIAGPKVIESAKAHQPLAFSFEAVDDAVKVKDWAEISKKLK